MMLTTAIVAVCILNIVSAKPAIFPLQYSAKGILTVYGTNATEIPSSSTMEIYRDSIHNQTLFKYDLGPWAIPYGWEYHVDVIRVENGKLMDYFWYLTYDNKPAKCIYGEWDGSSYRTFFYHLSPLTDSEYIGPQSQRGATTSCYAKNIANYGPAQQCYVETMDNDLIPWSSEGTGECCPGANRWDFADFNTNVTFENDFFDVPTNCSPR